MHHYYHHHLPTLNIVALIAAHCLTPNTLIDHI